MSIPRVAIIGVGLIGASIGLRLHQQSSPADLEVVGFDADPAIASEAVRSGALHRAARSLPEAVEGAALVVVSVPLSAVEDVFRAINNDLSAGAIVTDTAPVKEVMQVWAERHLPPHVGFVGGSPLVHLHSGRLHRAQADLFEGHEYAVIPGPSAQQRAVEAVLGLIDMLGARPYFVDAAEHDSLVALSRQVPDLLSAALLSAQARSRSKQDLSRFLVRPFYDVGRLLADDRTSADDAAWEYVSNEARINTWIDALLKVLRDLRVGLRERNAAALEGFLERAAEERHNILAVDVSSADSSKLDIPKSAEYFAELLVGRNLMERQKQLLGRTTGTEAGRKSRPQDRS